MINTLKKILGIGPSADYKALVKNGAQIIDVRTRGEYASGHIKGSINIPLNELNSHAKKIKKDTVIITCCASGMRSASAKGIIKQMGHSEVHNGGGWMSLNQKI
jgi:phage shock protein E